MDTKYKLGIIFGIASAALWGISGTFVQYLVQQRHFQFEWLISTRMILAGLGLLLISAYKKTDVFSVWRTPKDRLQILIFGLLGLFGVQFTFFAAIGYSNAATASVLQFAGPVIIAVYLALVHKQHPSKTQYLAIFLACLGVFLLVTHGQFQQLIISWNAFIFGIASAITMAIYTLYPKSLLAKHNSPAVIGWGMLIGALPAMFIKPVWQIEGQWNLSALASVAFIILFGTLLAFYIYLEATKNIGGQITSLLISIEPLTSIILAVVWLNTPYTLFDWLGSLCIISTVFLLSKKKTNHSSR